MATHAHPVPHFSGKNSLSLQDLDALANAVQAHSMTSEYVPAAPHRGHRQYTGANYNLASLVDECNGETAAPDKAGLLKSVQYSTTDAPYINEGAMVLPLAHDYSPTEDSSVPVESATGGILAINVAEDLRRPMIQRGQILLPLAESDWGDAEGAMCTPGLIHAVQYDAADDCEGKVLPYISQGVIHLPATSGTTGEDDCPATCSCALAQYNMGADVDTHGTIASVEFDASTLYSYINDGHVRLPMAHHEAGEDTCLARAGGICGIVQEDTTAPYIDSGTIHLPAAPAAPSLAYSYPDTACGGYVGTPGLIAGVCTTPLTDPFICAGFINLPLASSYVDSCAGIVAYPGLVAAVTSEDYDICAGNGNPYICQGVIHLPPASGLSGLYLDGHGCLDWADIPTGTLIPMTPAEAGSCAVSVLLHSGGYLQLFVAPS